MFTFCSEGLALYGDRSLRTRTALRRRAEPALLLFFSGRLADRMRIAFSIHAIDQLRVFVGDEITFHLEQVGDFFADFHGFWQETKIRNAFETFETVIGRDLTLHNFAEVIADRHAIDKLKERIERIERRLELQS